jgi:hypothetical protein
MALTERLGIGIYDHLIKRSLVHHKFSISVLLQMQQPGILLKLCPQLPRGLNNLLPGLLHLSIAGRDGLLQRPHVLKPSLDQLILELSGFVPLGF